MPCIVVVSKTVYAHIEIDGLTLPSGHIPPTLYRAFWRSLLPYVSDQRYLHLAEQRAAEVRDNIGYTDSRAMHVVQIPRHVIPDVMAAMFDAAQERTTP